MRNDYNSNSNPINQLYEYVASLKTNKIQDKDGRIIRVGVSTKFYLYAVCDITSTLEHILDFHDFSQTPDKMGYYKYNDKMKLILKYFLMTKLSMTQKNGTRFYLISWVFKKTSGEC